MAHSSTESVEDYDEDHGEYRDEEHGGYHQAGYGEDHDQDHGEYRDEYPGEYRDEEHGEYFQEDHGEYHDEDDGEYAFETSELRTSGATALLKNAIKAPGLKVIQLTAKSGEAWGVTSALVREKVSRASASINFNVFSFTHPFDPIRREAAKKAENQRKELASDRRKVREAVARGKASARIARAREGHIETLEEGVH